VNVISYGGGVQSTAMIVLATQGQIDADVGLFSNVGDDSEHPATLAYVRDVMIPWAAERGHPVHELRRTKRNGETPTLWQHLMAPSRSIDIPVRMANGAPGNRNCTQTYKLDVVRRWLRDHDALPAVLHIGISVDEIERAGRGRNDPGIERSYPLLGLGLSRNDCRQVIADAGLPVPPKSSCFFCPFHRPATWAEMRRDEPELFAKSQELEDTLNERRDALGKDHVYLTRFGRRLSDAIGVAQDQLFTGVGSDIGEAGCDEGVCFV
jgi:hypothetical protein